MALDPNQLRTATFNTKRRGYNPEDVDAFLRSLADRLAAGEHLSPADIASARFEVARKGYDPPEVDALLQQLREALEQS